MLDKIINYFVDPYLSYSISFIILETIAVIFGLISVWFARKENIKVFPTGLISTVIFVYLLFKWGLLGDMIINTYYTIMSIYGWYIWSRKTNNIITPISIMTIQDRYKSIFIFVTSFIGVLVIYRYKPELNNIFIDAIDSTEKFEFYSIIDFVDAFTTGSAFVAMWLMAKKKIENWYFWIITNFVSIPLYFFFKNHGITGVQYIIFLWFAILGLKDWRYKFYNNN